MAIIWDFPRPFIYDFNVLESDIDQFGHTNNAIYIQRCEQVAWRHSESLGLGMNEYRSLNRALVVHRAEFDYLLPSFKEDQLEVGTWITAIDNKLKLERRFQVYNTITEKVLCRGCWKLISINLNTGMPARMPQIFIDTYGDVLVSPL